MPFTVRVRDPHARHVRAFDEATPEAAALAYLEDVAHAPDAAIAIVVRDEDTGREQCFRVDLATGETRPCG